jgi:hypothetical protein
MVLMQFGDNHKFPFITAEFDFSLSGTPAIVRAMSKNIEKTRALGAPTGSHIANWPAGDPGVPVIWMEDFRP